MIADPRSVGRPPPPSRLRVLEVAQGWAGPMVSFLLAELGAEVIKVEDTRRFDWWRGPHPLDAARLPDGSVNAVAHEGAHVFNSVNRSKRGVTLDLATEAGRNTFLDLIRVSDLLVENFTPHAMHSLRLTFALLTEVNPALVMLSMPAFGLDGPWREYIAYGMTVEALSGMSSLTGYADGPSQMLGNAYGDAVSGINGAVAALVALANRERTGRGSHVEIAQVEAFIPLVAGALVGAQADPAPPPRRGNRHSSIAPHGVYPCQGEDAWVALSADSDAEWRALADVIGGAELATDPRFGDVVSRVRNQDALDALIRTWTRQYSREQARERLRAAGVTAEMVQRSPDVLADPRMGEQRGFFAMVERAYVGTHPYPRLPFQMSPPHPIAGLPAPCLGEHSDAVFTSLLGLSPTNVATLHETGVTGTVPRR